MVRSTAFEVNARRYDSWFEKHRGAYVSELLALRAFVPLQGLGLEIGVGTGRFAAPLGLQVGIDPAASMLAEARKRGISIVQGVAEALPFADGSFDHALVVTTLCFVDSPAAMLGEARRVLRPGGRLVMGFIDRATAVGRFYQDRQQVSPFYREATFHSGAEVEAMLGTAGYTIEGWAQTLSAPPSGREGIERVRPGRGSCGFVVVAATTTRTGSA